MEGRTCPGELITRLPLTSTHLDHLPSCSCLAQDGSLIIDFSTFAHPPRSVFIRADHHSVSATHQSQLHPAVRTSCELELTVSPSPRWFCRTQPPLADPQHLRALHPNKTAAKVGQLQESVSSALSTRGRMTPPELTTTLLSPSRHVLSVSIMHFISSTSFWYITVIGALIGIQKGREVEIVNSFELALERPPSAMDVEGEDRPVGGGGFGGEKVDWPFFEKRSGECESCMMFAWKRSGTLGR
jgi:hypothetical protein